MNFYSLSKRLGSLALLSLVSFQVFAGERWVMLYDCRDSKEDVGYGVAVINNEYCLQELNSYGNIIDENAVRKSCIVPQYDFLKPSILQYKINQEGQAPSYLTYNFPENSVSLYRFKALKRESAKKSKSGILSLKNANVSEVNCSEKTLHLNF